MLDASIRLYVVSIYIFMYVYIYISLQLLLQHMLDFVSDRLRLLMFLDIQHMSRDLILAICCIEGIILPSHIGIIISHYKVAVMNQYFMLHGSQGFCGSPCSQMDFFSNFTSSCPRQVVNGG